MAAIKAAIGDAVITFLWIFCVSTVGAATSIIASTLSIQSLPLTLLITTSLITLLVFVFNIIAEAMGGASFNPTGTAAFYAAGLGKDTLFSMALRFPAQAIGAVGGALAIVEYMPVQYKHMLSGPLLKVDLHTGAVAEGVLTFVITLAVLWIVVKGPSSPIAKTVMMSVSTVAVVIAGAEYTGPSMNPANAYRGLEHGPFEKTTTATGSGAFGWAYVDNRHNTWEQFYVYWICPFIGAVLAAWAFRILFPLPAPKAKKS